MALPASGQISLQDIATEYGGTAPHALSEYYSKGNAPASGEIRAGSHFHGTSAWNPTAATGGTVTTSGNFKIHRFTGSGTLNISQMGTDGLEVLVVAGGGGATTRHAGGAGGGGIVHQTGRIMSTGNHSIVVGAGGTGGARDSTSPTNGGDSTALGLTAKGGGWGGAYNILGTANGYGDGNDGGCGGGAMTRETGYFYGGHQTQTGQGGDSGTYGKGKDGGDNTSVGGCCAGCGGGGATVVGANSTGGAGGNGGNGFYAANFSSWGDGGWYSGGGGGAAQNEGSGTVGTGGNGGGGHGGHDNYNPTAGQANTGGGGGGNRNRNYTVGGGSGIVLIRYQYQ